MILLPRSLSFLSLMRQADYENKKKQYHKMQNRRKTSISNSLEIEVVLPQILQKFILLI